MIPATGTFDSALVEATFGLVKPWTSAQLATAAGLTAAFTSDQLRGRSGNSATPITIYTNEPSGSGFTRQQVVGYSGNRSLRVERYEFTGDASCVVKVYTSTTKDGTYTLRGQFNPAQSGMAYVDFTLATNSWIKYEIEASTAGGKKTARFQMVIWDLTAGERLAVGSWNDITVDADNNFVQLYKIAGGVWDYQTRNDGYSEYYMNEGQFSINRGTNPVPSSYKWSLSGTNNLYISGSSTGASLQTYSGEWDYSRGSYEQTVIVTCVMVVGDVSHTVSESFTYYGG